MHKYIITAIILISLITLYILCYKCDKVEGFRLKYCKKCGYKTHRECLSCVNCGYCETRSGNRHCLPGDKNGPTFAENCIVWKYRHPRVRYNYIYNPRRFYNYPYYFTPFSIMYNNPHGRGIISKWTRRRRKLNRKNKKKIN